MDWLNIFGLIMIAVIMIHCFRKRAIITIFIPGNMKKKPQKRLSDSPKNQKYIPDSKNKTVIF